MTTIEILKLLPEYLKVVALVIGGLWVYWKFIRQRENEPAADIDIDVKFVGIQDNQWIIEATSFVENKSPVKHKYTNFQVTIRYLLPDDKIEDSSKNNVNFQLDCRRTIDDRINRKKRFFDNVDYINPRQAFKHRYITFLPKEASFVWVQCKFYFGKNKFTQEQLQKMDNEEIKKLKKMSSQKIFRVPNPQLDNTAANKSIATSGADTAQHQQW